MEPPLIRQAGCSEEPAAAPAQGAGPPNQPALLLSEQPLRRKMALYYFKITGVFFSTSNTKQLFLSIDLSRASAPWVKSNIGALWYGDQSHYWVRRFININDGIFAYVTHRHYLPSENCEQNPYNSSVCRFLIVRYKMTTDIKWPWKLLEQGKEPNYQSILLIMVHQFGLDRCPKCWSWHFKNLKG